MPTPMHKSACPRSHLKNPIPGFANLIRVSSEGDVEDCTAHHLQIPTLTSLITDYAGNTIASLGHYVLKRCQESAYIRFT